MSEEHESNHIVIPPVVFYVLLCAAGFGGLGGGTFIGPQLERDALQNCFDNSRIALDVAAQHGEELNDLRALINNRTRDRYTADEAATDWREQQDRDILQNRRIDALERDVDKMDR